METIFNEHGENVILITFKTHSEVRREQDMTLTVLKKLAEQLQLPILSRFDQLGTCLGVHGRSVWLPRN